MFPLRLSLNLLAIFCCTVISAQPVISLSPRISNGLSEPIQFVNAGDNSDRVFIVQKGGTIRVYDAGFNFLSVFLTIPEVNNNNEQGLLSMAFHPDYTRNGYFYVFYVNDDDDLVLARYSVSGNPDIANPAGVVLFTIDHSLNENHNGGELHFGPDGNLYISTGDGGGAGDVPNNAQNTGVLLGKMLRIAVTTDGGTPYYTIPAGNPYNNEIYDLGLRNPFRWSFDRQTGDMWIADVGQSSFEEINFRAAASLPGVNYGWRCYEGGNVYNGAGCGSASDYLFPVYSYPTQDPAAAVTGGVVYRGSTYPTLTGYYISADFFSGTAYLISPDGNGGWLTSTQALSPTGIADFGEAENGELYAVSLTGNSVFQVVTTLDAPLPVTLVDFHGQVHNANDIKLDWQTAMEENIVAFEIGHSLDGSNFTPVGSVTAKNSDNGAAYSFIHADANPSENFYRLRILENDGSASFSQVLRIDMNERGKRLLYPSVVRDGMINIVAGNNSYDLVELYGMSGTLLYRKNIRGMTGTISVNIGDQHPGGIYIVRLTSNGNVVNSKIEIQ